MSPTRPFTVLSLDGGGIRGLSSLLILEKIMERIQQSEGLDTTPRPCERFDLIGGTSTGGIIAIMLGRLEMTVDQCIQTYKNLAKTAFSQQERVVPPESSSSAFSADNLTSAIKHAIRENCLSPTCVERREMGALTAHSCEHEDPPFYAESCTKTVVLAMTKDNIETLPTLFKTYDARNALSGCKLWEVARATSAAATLFESIKLGRDEIEFIDAGFGHNNPCESLIAEAKRHCQGRQMLILSIGTGLGDVVEIGETEQSIVEALKNMASSSKASDLRLKERYRGTGEYYRFNVENGLKDVTLSDWEKASKVSAHTNNYLREHEEDIQNFISATMISSTPQCPAQKTGLTSDPGPSIKLAELEGHAPVQYIPFGQNHRFVGREEVLSTLKGRLFAENGIQRMALVGLGGMGKTQIALKLAYWVKEAKPDYSIFWLTGASISGFNNACNDLVEYSDIKKRVDKFGIKVSDDKDTKLLFKHYLQSIKAGKWFLILDNADDIDVFRPSVGNGIGHFLPQSAMGRVLITTRHSAVAWSAIQDSTNIVDLQEMSHDDSAILLKRGVKNPEEIHDGHLIRELLEDLCHLPLAIAQAADYIYENSISPGDYLKLLRSANEDKIKLLARRHIDPTHHHSSQGSIFNTWIVTFQKIRKASNHAATLLEFISHIDAKAIPRSIFPVFSTEQEMTSAIGTLQAYGFLRKQQTPDLFDMHSLVHLTTTLWFENQGNQGKRRLYVLKHIHSVFPSHEWENRHIWRQHLPHALRVFKREQAISTSRSDLVRSVWRQHLPQALRVFGKEREIERLICSLGPRLGLCLSTDGNYQESVTLYEHVVATRKKALAADHPDLLSSQHNLADAYLDDRQVEKAITLFEHVLAKEEKALAADHPSLLTSQHNLANAYLDDRQVEKAILLLEHVVATRKKTLAADHPDLLSSQHNLARAYLDDRQVEKAITLFEHVLAKEEKALAVDHPDLLSSQHNLADAYLDDRQVEKAIILFEHVLAKEEKALAADHPSLLISQHSLARAYLDDRQVEKAITLFEHVVATRKKTLAADHPSLLTSQHNLANAYLEDRQVEKAITLLEHVVAKEEKALATGHPRLLTSQNNLAGAYLDDRQVEKAITLYEHVVATRKKTLAADHPGLLTSQHNLAGAYLDDRQVEKAITLLEHVVATSKKTLAAGHPRLLISQNNLARAYLDDRQVEKAITLLEHVVATRKKTLEADHPDLLSSQLLLERAYCNNKPA